MNIVEKIALAQVAVGTGMFGMGIGDEVKIHVDALQERESRVKNGLILPHPGLDNFLQAKIDTQEFEKGFEKDNIMPRVKQAIKLGQEWIVIEFPDRIRERQTRAYQILDQDQAYLNELDRIKEEIGREHIGGFLTRGLRDELTIFFGGLLGCLGYGAFCGLRLTRTQRANTVFVKH